MRPLLYYYGPILLPHVITQCLIFIAILSYYSSLLLLWQHSSLTCGLIQRLMVLKPSLQWRRSSGEIFYLPPGWVCRTFLPANWQCGGECLSWGGGELTANHWSFQSARTQLHTVQPRPLAARGAYSLIIIIFTFLMCHMVLKVPCTKKKFLRHSI